MATKNRIQLTKNFQNINELIDNFDIDTTYRMQNQSNNEIEIIESIDEPVVNPIGGLPANTGRVVVKPNHYMEYKQNGSAKLWMRVTFGIGYISVLGG